MALTDPLIFSQALYPEASDSVENLTQDCASAVLAQSPAENGEPPRRNLENKGKFGGRSRTRTYDPLIKSQLLYHLSYAP